MTKKKTTAVKNIEAEVKDLEAETAMDAVDPVKIEAPTDFVEQEEPTMSPEEEAAAIKKRIQELKDNAVNNQNMEAVRGIMSQLPTESKASQRGTPINEYAARVMASQSSDITVVPVLLGIAKTRKALKNQGYPLEEIEVVIDNLEKAYDI